MPSLRSSTRLLSPIVFGLALDAQAAAGTASNGSASSASMVVTHESWPKLTALPAMYRGKEVTCAVTFDVDASGRPASVEVASCPPVFAAAVRPTLLEWRFEPLSGADGAPVASRYLRQITYQVPPIYPVTFMVGAGLGHPIGQPTGAERQPTYSLGMYFEGHPYIVAFGYRSTPWHPVAPRLNRATTVVGPSYYFIEGNTFLLGVDLAVGGGVAWWDEGTVKPIRHLVTDQLSLPMAKFLSADEESGVGFRPVLSIEAVRTEQWQRLPTTLVFELCYADLYYY